MVSGDENLASTEDPITQLDRVEGVHPATGVADHLRNDQNTASVTLQQESSNGNATLLTNTIEGRNALCTTNEENLAYFMRDHPPPA
eukprot:14222009-Ditylum_brightwellii.AAC.1